MDEDLKRLLESNIALSKENNELLYKLYKVQRFAQITRVVYWILLLGIAAGAFYFVQPFLDTIFNAYGIEPINIKNLLK